MGNGGQKFVAFSLKLLHCRDPALPPLKSTHTVSHFLRKACMHITVFTAGPKRSYRPCVCLQWHELMALRVALVLFMLISQSVLFKSTMETYVSVLFSCWLSVCFYIHTITLSGALMFSTINTVLWVCYKHAKQRQEMHVKLFCFNKMESVHSVWISSLAIGSFACVSRYNSWMEPFQGKL